MSCGVRLTNCSKGSGAYTSFRAIASQFYGATLRSGTTPFSKALGVRIVMKLNFKESIVYIVVSYPIVFGFITVLFDRESLFYLIEQGTIVEYLALLILALLQGVLFSLFWQVFVALPIAGLYKIKALQGGRSQLISFCFLLSVFWPLFITFIALEQSQGRFMNGFETAVLFNSCSAIFGIVGGYGLSRA